jgi:hypothetical protein
MTSFRIAGPESEQPLTSRHVVWLQEPIYRAAALARWIRFGAPLFGALWVSGRNLFDTYQRMQDSWPTHEQVSAPLRAALFVALFSGGPFIGGLCGLAVGLPLAAFCRWVCGRRLRRKFENLTTDQRKRVLYPLCGAEGDPGRIADRLASDFRLERYRLEVAPSGAPDGRGDELAACARERVA